MSTSDGNSTTRPLRRRQSKRFDRSGGTSIGGGPTVIDEDDLDVDLPDGPLESSPDHAPPSVAPDVESATPEDSGGNGAPSDVEEDGEKAESDTPTPTPPASGAAQNTEPPPSTGIGGVSTEPSNRRRSLDQLTACGRCGHEVSTVDIEVDGNILMMESCDNCDTRRWELAGEPIELQAALDHVGEHTGRRR